MQVRLGEGGETGQDNRILEETFKRPGVSIMGKRMFDGGERFWSEETLFHTPVFVVTKQVRRPWECPGGTTFHFVNDGIASALRQAHAIAGDRDTWIAGGANAIIQYLKRGPVRRDRPAPGRAGDRGDDPLAARHVPAVRGHEAVTDTGRSPRPARERASCGLSLACGGPPVKHTRADAKHHRHPRAARRSPRRWWRSQIATSVERASAPRCGGRV
jgi:hypothetical protein